MGTVNEALSNSISRLYVLDQEAEEDTVQVAITNLKTVFDLDDLPIDLLEKMVSASRADRQKIISDDIPCILSEYGLSQATMEDGTQVSLDVAYETKQKDKALLGAWLEEMGYGSIIKDKFSFEKGSVDEELNAFLAARGYSYSRDLDINAMSLKATLKRHIESGGERPPIEAAEIKVFGYAKIKPPKVDF